MRVAPAGELGVTFWGGPWRRDGGVRRGEVERRRAAAHLDSLGRLLGVAGWAAAAREARGLRDRLLAGAAEVAGADGAAEVAGVTEGFGACGGSQASQSSQGSAGSQGSGGFAGLGGSEGEVARDYARFARRVRRSKVLRWTLRGAGVIEPGPGVPGWMRGDALERCYRWIERAAVAIDELGDSEPGARSGDMSPGPEAGAGAQAEEGAEARSGFGARARAGAGAGAGAAGPGVAGVEPVAGAGPGTAGAESVAGAGSEGAGWRGSAVAVAMLPGLLVGVELGVGRLIVASLDPDVDEVLDGTVVPGE
ncbi:hypothetical protein [Nonomuraea rosea]|uniref:hypothetical protein n=1 Tax=Nonomuraea rosea TaxID=638574 RepID=UPI0031E8852C